MTFTTLSSPSAMQAWIVRELLDAFPLEAAARIINIGLAFSVGEWRHSSGHEHLHHQRCAGARQSLKQS